jgi:hypothetical protein
MEGGCTVSKYLIEVPHDKEMMECARAVQVFLSTGSHFLANAEWGCADGEHKAWMIVEVENREQARSIVPPNYRSQAKIVTLVRFELKQVAEALRDHAQ